MCVYCMSVCLSGKPRVCVCETNCVCVRMSVTRRSFEVISVTSDYAGTLGSQSGGSSQGKSSQPSSSSLLRSSSRFRVIRLATGRAEPYCRGRWTCRDFLESEEGAGLRRMMESMRHAHSLESLDIIRQLPLRKGEGLHVLSQRPIKTDMRPFRGLQPIRLPLLDSNQPIEDSALPPQLLNVPVLQLDTTAQVPDTHTQTHIYTHTNINTHVHTHKPYDYVTVVMVWLSW